MEETLKRIRVSEIDLENEEEVLECANKQEYVQPERKLLNRPLLESYNFLAGSERIILNEFYRRCAEKERYRPEGKNDAFYFALRSEMSEDVLEMYDSKELKLRLRCVELKRQQRIIRDKLKTNLIFVEKLLRWKYDFFKTNKIEDKEKLFQFETLFKFFVLRRKEIHQLLTDVNNHIAVVIIRANESDVYFKNAVKML